MGKPDTQHDETLIQDQIFKSVSIKDLWEVLCHFNNWWKWSSFYPKPQMTKMNEGTTRTFISPVLGNSHCEVKDKVDNIEYLLEYTTSRIEPPIPGITALRTQIRLDVDNENEVTLRRVIWPVYHKTKTNEEDFEVKDALTKIHYHDFLIICDDLHRYMRDNFLICDE